MKESIIYILLHNKIIIKNANGNDDGFWLCYNYHV